MAQMSTGFYNDTPDRLTLWTCRNVGFDYKQWLASNDRKVMSGLHQKSFAGKTRIDRENFQRRRGAVKPWKPVGTDRREI